MVFETKVFSFFFMLQLHKLSCDNNWGFLQNLVTPCTYPLKTKANSKKPNLYILSGHLPLPAFMHYLQSCVTLQHFINLLE